MNCLIVDDEPLAVDVIVSYVEQVGDINIVETTNNPLEVIRILKQHQIDLVFLDIENLNATDYLVKPIPFSRFLKAVSRAREVYELKKSRENVGEPAKIAEIIPPKDYIFVKAEYENIKLETSNILFIEGLKDYLKIHLKSESKAVLTLSNFRVHRSFLVNIDAISAYRKGKLIIGASRISIGETYKKNVFETLGL